MTLVVLLGIAVIASVAWFTWRRGRGNLGRVINYSSKSRGVRRETWQNYSASEAELERMVGREAAERLIVNVLLNNSGNSRMWCADKALQDLRRDSR